MSTNTREPIQPDILERLAERASETGDTVNGLLRRLLDDTALKDQYADDGETIGSRLQRKGLLGTADSSKIDPTSLPRHTPFGQLVAEKLKKQGLIIP